MAPLPPATLLLPLLLLLAAASEEQQVPIHIHKCCKKSEEWDMRTWTCVSNSWRKPDRISFEVLKPPIDVKTASWLPEVLRTRTVIAHYDQALFGNDFAVLKLNASILEQFLRVNVSIGVFAVLDLFHPPLDPRAVWDQLFCFERSLNSSVGDVMVTGASTRMINKCCPEGQILTADARGCEANVSYWVPVTPWLDIGGIRYEQIEEGFPFPWNVALPAAKEDHSRWRVMSFAGKHEMTVWVRGSVGGREVQGVAWKYCFDVAAPGKFFPLVLLAALVDVRKCCSRTQRLSADGQQCEEVEKKGGVKVNEETGVMGVIADEKVENSVWMPESLRYFLNASDGVATVAYYTHWGLESVQILDADGDNQWFLNFPDEDPPQMWITRGSHDVRQKVEDWCFDVQAGRGRVLLIDSPCKAADVLCLPKCCPTGSLLKADGSCRTRPAAVGDWDPHRSAAAPFLPDNITLIAHYDLLMPCLHRRFLTHNPDGARAAHLLQERSDEGYFRDVFHCVDSQLREDGTVEEVFAYCEVPPIAGVYVVVRPLQLLAVLLLAVGLAAILRDEDTRRSLQRSALACHAFCLLLSNSLQTAWFFTHRNDRPCELFAYSIYFFLVAAGVWLNVISINMAVSFRRPLGARAAKQHRGSSIWRSLALWSVYGWGVPAALTTLSVYMHLNGIRLGKNLAALLKKNTCFKDKPFNQDGKVLRDCGFENSFFHPPESTYASKYSTPTFLETRTCFGEETVNLDGAGKVNLGTVFYYYLPMSLLVVANGVCLMLTTSTIMAMKKNTAVLHKLGASTTTRRRLENARMYVKLLLSAGVMEIAVEVAAWVLRPRDWSSNVHQNRTHAQQMLFIFHIAATFVDVARALAVLWLAVGRWRWPWAWPCNWWRSVAAWAAREWSLLWRNRSQTPPPTVTPSSSTPLPTCPPPSTSTESYLMDVIPGENSVFSNDGGHVRHLKDPLKH